MRQASCGWPQLAPNIAVYTIVETRGREVGIQLTLKIG